VGPDAAVPTPPAARLLEFQNGVLVPGLVNCHTHLELTHLAGRSSEPGFATWIRRVRELKDGSTHEELVAGAERGVRDGWARGVTCVADTGSSGAAMAALARLGGRGVCYQEVFGPDPAKVGASMAELEAQLARLRPLASSRLRLGVSPHAPYTVSEPLYRAVAERAAREGLPVAVHLAESREETALVRDGDGPFAEELRARGIAVVARGCSPVEYLSRLGLIASSPLCIHCVHVDDADISTLAAAGAAIAHCPRSNRAHGHGAAPLAAFRAAGLRVGLGTDSVVSVPAPDLWAEAEQTGLGFEEALRMLTLEGARALGWEDEVGSLDVGKAGDLAVFASSVLLRPSSSSAFLTVVGGRVVWGTGSEGWGTGQRRDAMPKTSAGLLMYRRRGSDLEVLLVHPGGPFWWDRDLGAWSIPKGEMIAGEDPLAVARREFEEETGVRAEGTFEALGSIRQKGGKTVHAWAFAGDLDPAATRSNTFAMEWPPGSGQTHEFPEVDRAAFFGIDEAKTKINPGQVPLLERLAQLCKQDPGDEATRS